jgi:arabinogalactan oligomer / maltooligosaccharide transport system permease protein
MQRQYPKQIPCDSIVTDPTHQYPFWSWATNSVGVALATMIICVLISLPAAYALSRFEFLGKQGVLLSFLITQMFPGALLLVPLYRLFSDFGLLGHPYALVIAYATTSLPFSVYMMKNFFDAVPRELDQAGLVDGLGPFGVFWRIITPLTIPGIAVVAFFNFMNAWNEFMLARAFLTDNNSLTLPVGLQSFVFAFGVDWGRLTAAALLVTIPVFILFVWAQRYLIAGLTGGSVKG